MPQIIVIADSPAEDGAAQVLFRERVTGRLFESGHFAKQLVERLGWAVGDAEVAEHGRRGRRAKVIARADTIMKNDMRPNPAIGSESEPGGPATALDTTDPAQDVSAETSERQPPSVVAAVS